MLTGNFAEIIQVIKHKLESHTLHTLSSDEIGNINLMLRGYLGLIQHGFQTPNDSKLPSEQYGAWLLDMLSQLASIQEQKIKHKKQTLFDNLMAEVNAIFKQMDSTLTPSKSVTLNALKDSKQLFHQQLTQCLNDPTQGCIEIIRTTFELSSQMNEQFLRLNKKFKLKQLATCQEQFSLVTTTYLKQMTQGYTLETDNHHCLSFIASTQLGDHFLNGF